MGMNAQSECVQGERVMRKRGPGWLRSGVGILLLGAWGAVSWAEDETGDVPATEPAAEATPVDFKTKVQARLDALTELSAAEIEQVVLASEQAMRKLNEDAQAARFATRVLQEKMRLENPEVQAKYREIDEMRSKIDEFIDSLPEVKALMEAEDGAQEKLLEESLFRAGAMGLVARKDRAAGFPARPEAVLPEAETGATEPVESSGATPAKPVEDLEQ